MGQLQSRIRTPHISHIWLNICAFPHILGSPSSYMTLQLHAPILNFLIYEEN
jgi:hypothetical protein